MDHVSLVETVRHRSRLRLQGLRLPESECTSSDQDLMKMNLHIVTGDAGWETVVHGYELLIADPTSDAKWCPEYEVEFSSCAPLLVGSMCDSWRRLVLPYQNVTSAILQVAVMDDFQEGIEFLWREYRKVSCCNLCRDLYFATTSGLL